MDALQRMLIERECERLVTRYCHLVDHGQAAQVAELFTEDGAWASPEATVTGREQIRASFQRRQDAAARMSRHVCGNLLIDVEDADHASGVVYLTLYRHDGDPARRISPSAAPSVVGEYRDRFRRTPDGWRIARREVEVSFLGA